MADLFRKSDALKLLSGKRILLFGDSNIRALYKDLVWLFEDGTLVSQIALKKKNEASYMNDRRVSDGQLLNSRNYEEIREYNKKVYLRFQFITRLYLPCFINYLDSLKTPPDVIVINSCLWDLSRWGPTGVGEYKINLQKTFAFLNEKFASTTRIIWLTTLPPSFTINGSLLTKEIEFLRSLLPFHIIEANCYAKECANRYEFDVLDLHFHMRFLIQERVHDGIHWNPKSVRYLSNLLLTHIALSCGVKLPGNAKLDEDFVCSSSVISRKCLDGKNKENYLEKLGKLEMIAEKIQVRTLEEKTEVKPNRKVERNKLETIGNVIATGSGKTVVKDENEAKIGENKVNTKRKKITMEENNNITEKVNKGRKEKHNKRGIIKRQQRNNNYVCLSENYSNRFNNENYNRNFNDFHRNSNNFNRNSNNFNRNSNNFNENSNNLNENSKNVIQILNGFYPNSNSYNQSCSSNNRGYNNYYSFNDNDNFNNRNLNNRDLNNRNLNNRNLNNRNLNNRNLNNRNFDNHRNYNNNYYKRNNFRNKHFTNSRGFL